MIQNIVGPPGVGIPGVAPGQARNSAGDGSGSFEATLEATARGVTGTTPPGKGPDVPLKEPDSQSPPRVFAKDGVKPVEPPMSAREKAIQKFMDSFESEFGIPPTEIVGAMALLDPEKLSASPESSAVEVIESLGLDEEETERALQMYGNLLSELKSLEQGPQRLPVPPVATEDRLLSADYRQRHALATDRREMLNQGVEKLNQNFWKTSGFEQPQPQSPAGLVPSEDRLASPRIHHALMEDVDSMVEPRVATKGEIPGEIQRASALTAAGFMVPQRAMGRSSVASMTDVKGQMIESENAHEAPAASFEGSEQSIKKPDLSATSHFEMGENLSEWQGSEHSAFADGLDEPMSRTSGKDSPQPLRLEDVAAVLRQSAPAVGGAAASVTTLGAGAGAPVPGEPGPDNIQQVMNQAQYLIKRGGGEMKVQMNPEGMGHIHLKVLVQDGKVNVQMAAETSEAKRALESSLPELRSSLAGHKLSMDHVKVDVITGPSSDTGARNDGGQQSAGGRDGARQFWNQFQEQFGNRSRNDGFWEIPALKGYQRSKPADPLQPMDGEARPASRGEGRGRLNLVA